MTLSSIQQKLFIASAVMIMLSCNKTELPATNTVVTPPPPPPPPPVTIPCSNRPEINARLISVGRLTEGRMALASAAAGSKILFAGGIKTGAYSSRVDIYDTLTHSWSTAELTIPQRQGMAVASVGNKILFAGGEDGDWIDLTSRVDIYDAASNSWSTAELSQPRSYLAAATIGNKVFFAGGAIWQNYKTGSTVVDIYDNATNTWSTANLSEGRYELSATTVGNKIYFAGGIRDIFSVSGKIDVYNGETNSWSVLQLQEPRTSHAAIAVNSQIFWAGGAKTSYQYGYDLSNQVEIKDAFTGASTLTCMTPKCFFKAIVREEEIIFFTGNLKMDTYSGTHFEIYNTITGQWSTGVLSKQVNDATIICVNNTIYVAGGRDQPWGPYFNDVWRLEF